MPFPSSPTRLLVEVGETNKGGAMIFSSATKNPIKIVSKTKPPLTICMVTDDFLPAKTGVGVHVQKIVQELARRGHRVIVLTSRRPGQPDHETWNGALIHRFFSIPAAGFYQALPLRSTIAGILGENRVDLVHFHYLGFMMLNVMRVARSLHLPTVYTAHMTVDALTQPLFMKPFHRPLLWGYQWLMNRVDHIVCVSQQQRKEFKTCSAQTLSISNPIDFRGDEAVDSPQTGRFRILYVGRLEPKKNVRYLVSAFQILAARKTAIELTIAGVGTEEEKLHRQVQRAGLSGKVTFLGHVPHDRLPALYAACEVFVLPFILETQGMVVLEAMRFRRPVIVTNKNLTAHELVEPGTNGFIVDPKSALDLADKLAYLYDNPARRKQMGEAGFTRIPFDTSETVAEKLETLYARVRGNTVRSSSSNR